MTLTWRICCNFESVTPATRTAQSILLFCILYLLVRNVYPEIIGSYILVVHCGWNLQHRSVSILILFLSRDLGSGFRSGSTARASQGISGQCCIANDRLARLTPLTLDQFCCILLSGIHDRGCSQCSWASWRPPNSTCRY